MYQQNYDYIYHYGIKGMKWGVRRYQNKDGSLTPAGIKKYAKAGYSEDAYRSNKSSLGKVYDTVTGAHKTAGSIMYKRSSDAANRARATKYVKDHSSSNRYKPTKDDKAIFGEKEAQRIADRRNKGDSRNLAVAKSYGKTFLKGAAGGAAVSALVYGITSGKLSSAASSAAKKAYSAGRKMYDSYYNVQVLDSSGKILKGMHQNVKVGEVILDRLLSR